MQNIIEHFNRYDVEYDPYYKILTIYKPIPTKEFVFLKNFIKEHIRGKIEIRVEAVRKGY